MNFYFFCSLQDLLEPPLVPYTEPYSFSWYDKHLEMSTTIAQHGFCLFANESIAKGTNSGLKVNRVNLSSEILSSSTNTTLVGKLITQDSFSDKDSEINSTTSDVSLKRYVYFNCFYVFLIDLFFMVMLFLCVMQRNRGSILWYDTECSSTKNLFSNKRWFVSWLYVFSWPNFKVRSHSVIK